MSAKTTNVQVVMRDDTGAQIGSASLPLAGKGHTAFVLSDKFLNLASQRGTIEFDTPSGGRISVLGLRFPPGEQFTTIPVIASIDPGHSAFVISDQFLAAANRTGTIEFDAPAGSRITVLGLRFPASGAFSTIPVVTP